MDNEELGHYEDGYWVGPLKNGYPANYFDEEDNFKYPWQNNNAENEIG